MSPQHLASHKYPTSSRVSRQLSATPMVPSQAPPPTPRRQTRRDMPVLAAVPPFIPQGGVVPSIIPSPSVWKKPSTQDGTTKKSHARPQPAGHVPRPRNAFILFRCDFVAQDMVPKSIEKEHRNISRIAGRVWQSMSDAQRAPWVSLAEQERDYHRKVYPQYRFKPRERSEKNKAPEDASSLDVTARQASSSTARVSRFERDPPDSYLERRGSLSCPPPLSPPPTDLQFLPNESVIQDNIHRRQDRVATQNPYPTEASGRSNEGDILWDWDLQPTHRPSSQTPTASDASELVWMPPVVGPVLELDSRRRLPRSHRESSSQFVQESFGNPFGASMKVESLDTAGTRSGMGRSPGPSSLKYSPYGHTGPRSGTAAPLARVAQLYETESRSTSRSGGSSRQSRSSGGEPSNFGRSRANFVESKALSSYQHGLRNNDIQEYSHTTAPVDEVDQIIDDLNKFLAQARP